MPYMWWESFNVIEDNMPRNKHDHDLPHRKCGFIHYSDPRALVNINSKDNRERSTDYAINVLYVVGFLSVGDRGTEAARLLGLLGLANSTTMKTRSFTIIEERISPSIRTVTNNMLLENNIIAEVRAMTP
jgi:hypothetical protein